MVNIQILNKYKCDHDITLIILLCLDAVMIVMYVSIYSILNLCLGLYDLYALLPRSNMSINLSP